MATSNMPETRLCKYYQPLRLGKPRNFRLARAGGTQLPIGVSGRLLSWQAPQLLSSCILRPDSPANWFSVMFSPRQKLCLAADYGGTTQFIEIWIDQSDNLRAVIKAPSHRPDALRRLSLGRKRRVSVGVILLQVDVLIGEIVQANRPEKRLCRLDQQDRPGKTVVVEAAPEMNPRLDRHDLEGVDVQPQVVERKRIEDLHQIRAQDQDVV